MRDHHGPFLAVPTSGLAAHALQQADDGGVMLEGVELLHLVHLGVDRHVLRLRFDAEAVEVGDRLGERLVARHPAGVAGDLEEPQPQRLEVIGGQQTAHEQVAVALHAPAQLRAVGGDGGGIEKRGRIGHLGFSG